MEQVIKQQHSVDGDGNPAGGSTSATGMRIDWQNGPIPRDSQGNPMYPRNGAFVEDLIAAVIGRIEFYQASKFNCRENDLALTKLQEALHWLNHRTQRRISQGVEGTHQGS